MPELDSLAPGNTLCLIVTYNGSDTITRCISSLLPQIEKEDKILVIDNASDDDTLEVMNNLGLDSIEIISWNKNFGVGKAYNTGLNKAISEGYQWLFLLDQDSVCDPKCFEILRSEANRIRQINVKLGCLFPTVKSKLYPEINHWPFMWTGYTYSAAVKARTNRKTGLPMVDSSITSGTLYNVKALKRVNGFNEKYFIDFIDHECHINLKIAGFKSFWVTDAVLLHELGKPVEVKDRIEFIHEPFRYYYIGRNYFDAFWKFGKFKGLRAFFKGAKKIFEILKEVYPDNPRYKQSVKYFRKGIFHAVIRKFGPLN